MRHRHLKTFATARGFTVVELVVYLVVAAIVAGLVGSMVTTPIDAYLAQARRAEMSDSAESAMRWIADDVHKALPESLRSLVIGGSQSLVMIEVSAAANYRAWVAPDTADPLAISSPDNIFDVAGIQGTPTSRSRLVVVYSHLDTGYGASYEVYQPGAAVITATGNSVTYTSNTHRFTLGSAHAFPRDSMNKRVYAVEGVTRYECDTGAGVLRRYAAADINIDQAFVPVAAPSTIIARDVTSCSFQILDSTATHGGIAIVRLTVSRIANGNTENIQLVKQLRVGNLP